MKLIKMKATCVEAVGLTEEEQKAYPSFHIWIDPGEADSEALKKLFEAISDCHKANGGSGLVFEPVAEQGIMGGYVRCLR